MRSAEKHTNLGVRGPEEAQVKMREILAAATLQDLVRETQARRAAQAVTPSN